MAVPMEGDAPLVQDALAAADVPTGADLSAKAVRIETTARIVVPVLIAMLVSIVGGVESGQAARLTRTVLTVTGALIERPAPVAAIVSTAPLDLIGTPRLEGTVAMRGRIVPIAATA